MIYSIKIELLLLFKMSVSHVLLYIALKFEHRKKNQVTGASSYSLVIILVSLYLSPFVLGRDGQSSNRIWHTCLPRLPLSTRKKRKEKKVPFCHSHLHLVLPSFKGTSEIDFEASAETHWTALEGVHNQSRIHPSVILRCSLIVLKVS